MVISSTRPVETRIQAVWPESRCGVTAAAGSAAPGGVASWAKARPAASSEATPTAIALPARIVRFIISKPPKTSCLQRVIVGFARADADRLHDVEDEDLAIADLAGLGGGLDRLHHAVDDLVGDGHLDLHLGQEVYDIFGAAIDLGLALLAAESLDLADGEALDAERRQGFADFVELERLDDRHNQLHRSFPIQKSALFISEEGQLISQPIAYAESAWVL